MQLKIVGALFIAAAAVATPVASAAQSPNMIYLKCLNSDGSGPAEQLTIDLSARTVNNHPASINPTSFDWEYQGPGDPTGTVTGTLQQNHIDRVSGVYTTNITYYWKSGPPKHGDSRKTCTAGEAPATKF